MYASKNLPVPPSPASARQSQLQTFVQSTCEKFAESLGSLLESSLSTLDTSNVEIAILIGKDRRSLCFAQTPIWQLTLNDTVARILSTECKRYPL